MKKIALFVLLAAFALLANRGFCWQPYSASPAPQVPQVVGPVSSYPAPGEVLPGTNSQVQTSVPTVNGRPITIPIHGYDSNGRPIVGLGFDGIPFNGSHLEAMRINRYYRARRR